MKPRKRTRGRNKNLIKCMPLSNTIVKSWLQADLKQDKKSFAGYVIGSSMILRKSKSNTGKAQATLIIK